MTRNDRRLKLALRRYSYGKNNRVNIGSVIRLMNLNATRKVPDYTGKLINAFLKFYKRRLFDGKEITVGVLGEVAIKGRKVNYSGFVDNPVHKQYTNEHSSGIKYSATWFKSRWIKKRSIYFFYSPAKMDIYDKVMSNHIFTMKK